MGYRTPYLFLLKSMTDLLAVDLPSVVNTVANVRDEGLTENPLLKYTDMTPVRDLRSSILNSL